MRMMFIKRSNSKEEVIMNRKMLFVVFCAVISFAIPFNISSAIGKTVKLKYAHGAAPKTFEVAVHAAAVAFKHVMEQRSCGRFQVEIYPSSILGKQIELLESVKKNTIQFACATPGGLHRIFPPGVLPFAPYAFKNEEVAVECLEGPFGRKLLDGFTDKTGIRGLAITPKYSYLAITNSVRPIRTPADMKGIKFRAMDTLQLTMFKALGASAVPISFAELYTSLQTGVVHGQTNSTMIVAWQKFWEVQKYLTIAKTQFASQWIVCNKEWYDGLSPKDKLIVRDASKAAAHASVGLSILLEATVLEELKKKMEIYVLSDKEMVEFEKLAKPKCIGWLKTKMDPKWVDDFLNAVEDTEKKLGY
jgi:tripartite ATP-independent transporter DctP family solute receptor